MIALPALNFHSKVLFRTLHSILHGPCFNNVLAYSPSSEVPLPLVSTFITNNITSCAMTIHILRKHISRLFGPPPPYVSTFLFLKISKDCHFSDTILRNAWVDPLCCKNIMYYLAFYILACMYFKNCTY